MTAVVRATCLISVLFLTGGAPAAAPPPGKDARKPTFARDVAPLVKTYCGRCHTGGKKKGGIALDRDKDDEAVKKNRKVWEKVADNLRAGEMPPAGARKPTAVEMDLINRWLDAVVFK